MAQKKLAIITTHPVQYYAPVFVLMHGRQQINFKVFYTWSQARITKYDPGFGKEIEWNIPLLEGYSHEWVENIAEQPGSHHFKGIINPSLNQKISDFQPDAILVFGWSYDSHLKAMRYFKGKTPVYFRGDSTLLDEIPLWRKILRYTSLRWIYRYVDHAFYVGSNNKAYFKYFGLKEDELSFAPHAVDNERFGLERNDEAYALRNELGITRDDILILFAGKFEEKKSPELLLEVFEAIKQPHVHLLMVGDGKLEEVLINKVKGIDNVHFLPFQNQSYMPVVYQACDLFCLPSKGPGETWGLAVNEAMACGKAILTSDKVGCAVDLVIPGKNGCIFKNGDKTDFKEKMISLVSDKSLLVAFGEESKQIIMNWNFLKIIESVEDKQLRGKNNTLNEIMFMQE